MLHLPVYNLILEETKFKTWKQQKIIWTLNREFSIFRNDEKVT